MKKLVIRIVVVAVALLVVALGVVFFSLNSIVKKGVETVGPQLTQVEVRLGGANLSPLSGNGQLTELFVGNPKGFKTPSAIKVRDIKVGLQLSSLLSDTVVVETVNIQFPEITMEASFSGNNLTKILDNLESSAGGSDKTGKPEQPGTKSEKRFQVKDVVVQGGKINLGVVGLNGKVLIVPLPELHLQNIGTGGAGVSAAELAKQIMTPLLASVTKAAGEAMQNLGKEMIGKETTEQINKAGKGIKDLFKKVPGQ